MRNIVLTLIISTDAPVESFTDKTLSLMVNDSKGIWTPTIINAIALEEKPTDLNLAIMGPQKAISQSPFSNMAMNMMDKI